MLGYKCRKYLKQLKMDKPKSALFGMTGTWHRVLCKLKDYPGYCFLNNTYRQISNTTATKNRDLLINRQNIVQNFFYPYVSLLASRKFHEAEIFLFFQSYLYTIQNKSIHFLLVCCFSYNKVNCWRTSCCSRSCQVLIEMLW